MADRNTNHYGIMGCWPTRTAIVHFIIATLLILYPLLSGARTQHIRRSALADRSVLEEFVHEQYLTGNWSGFRARMSNAGISPYLTYTPLTFTNIHGGIRTGTRWGGLLALGSDFSFERLWGWKGATVHIGWHWWLGDQPSSELIGNYGPDALSGWEASNAFRFYNLYYLQSYRNGDYLLKVGQIALDDNFMLSTYSQLFLNTAFGDMPSRAATSNAPVYPLAAPGLYFYAKPGDDWFIRAGIYTSDAGEDVVGNNGFGWRLGGDTGFSMMLEPGIETELFGLPATYKIGALYNTADLEQLGGSKTVNGNYDIYAVADQVLWMDENRKPLLSVFARVGVNPLADRTEVAVHVDAGVNYFGPIPGRTEDTIGIGVSYTRFTDAFVRASANEGRKISTQETALEITYQAVLTPWFTLQPDVQFVLEPVFGRRDAYVLVFQGVINF